MALKILSPVHKMSRLLGIHLSSRMNNLELLPQECHVLSFLKKYPSRLSVIQKVFGLKQSTLTSMLDRMERKKMIERREDPRDRRARIVHVTHKGTVLVNHLQKHLDELESLVLACISKRDLKGFEAVVKAVEQVTGIQLK